MSVAMVTNIACVQSEIGFGKIQTYTRLEKLGEVSNTTVFVNCLVHVSTLVSMIGNKYSKLP